ncbi:MAG: hypothetical protein OXB88_09650, partial [Bacteriovoracales bacterium]|nr:hypothetical protein [Bacteriovoracales bacterium]
ALADFFPAHYKDNPTIVISPVLGMERDISLKPILPLPITSDPHATGGPLAYALWKLRKHIGKEKITHLLRPFLNNLNQYHESFRENLTTLKMEHSYFIAVLKKTLQEQDKNMDGVIKQITIDLGLNLSTVNDIARSLKRSDRNFYAPSDGNKIPSITKFKIILLTIVVDGLLYIFFF